MVIAVSQITHAHLYHKQLKKKNLKKKSIISEDPPNSAGIDRHAIALTSISGIVKSGISCSQKCLDTSR